MKKEFSPQQKALIALEAIREVKSTNQIVSEYEVHPVQVGLWKKMLLERAPLVFSEKPDEQRREQQELIDRLYKVVGQRDIELDWLKKKLHLDT